MQVKKNYAVFSEDVTRAVGKLFDDI